MSRREQKLADRKRKPKPPGPITRRQQVEAVRQVKGQEIAAAVADRIRDAVKQEVKLQLKVVKDTMFMLIDRVTEVEARQSVVLMRRAQDEVVEGTSDGARYHEDMKRNLKRVRDESNGTDRQEREEGSEVQQDSEVVQGTFESGTDCFGEDEEEGPAGR